MPYTLIIECVYAIFRQDTIFYLGMYTVYFALKVSFIFQLNRILNIKVIQETRSGACNTIYFLVFGTSFWFEIKLNKSVWLLMLNLS